MPYARKKLALARAWIPQHTLCPFRGQALRRHILIGGANGPLCAFFHVLPDCQITYENGFQPRARFYECN